MSWPSAATLLVPGQGAQKVGMGRALYALGGAARRAFDAADEALDAPLTEIMFEGPPERLRQTEHLQPALVTLAVAEAERLGALGVRPVAAIGHSVGQYAALVIAGALRFEDAVRLVRERGRLMTAALPAGGGVMALVVGIPRADVRRACAAAAEETGEIVEVACHNAPEQTVVAGTRAGVDAALDRCEDAGCAIVELDVSVPFHCALVAQAAVPLAALLAQVDVRPPALVVYDTVSGRPLGGPEDVRHALVEQVASPVRFEACLRAALAAGHDGFVHCGPGRGLAPLVRAIAPDARVAHLSDYEATHAASRLATAPLD